MNILLELENKIEELRKSGMTDSQIKVEGLVILKKILKNAPLKDRQHFFLNYERDKKLKILLGDDDKK